jgi:hypothetical protein
MKNEELLKMMVYIEGPEAEYIKVEEKQIQLQSCGKQRRDSRKT